MDGGHNTQKEEIFETPDVAENEEKAQIDVTIEIDMTSLTEFLKLKSQIAEDLWDESQREKKLTDEDEMLLAVAFPIVGASGKRLEGPDAETLSEESLELLLHRLLRKWWAWKNNGERLKPSQTKQAVKHLRAEIESKEQSKYKSAGGTNRAAFRAFLEKLNNTKVEEEKVDPLRAFSTFAGKVFDPSDTGEPANTRVFGKQKVDYLVYSTAPASSRERRLETPLQRFRRLKAEVEEFKSSLESYGKQQAQSPSHDLAADLAKELQGMWQTLEAGEAGEMFPSDASKGMVPSTELFKRLGAIGSAEGGKVDQSAGPVAGGSSPATLSLYAGAGVPTGDTAATLKELTARLEDLENAVGKPQERGTDAISQLSLLSSRLDLVGDPSKLKKLGEQIRQLNTSLRAVQMKSSAYWNELEKVLAKGVAAKAEKMFNMMSQWDEAAQQVPQIMDRLDTLSSLHSESAQAAGKLNLLKEQQSSIKHALEEDKRLLAEVGKSLADNANKISANIESMDKRMAAIAAKLG